MWNGNRQNGIKMMVWNKGAAALETKMSAVKQLIDDNQPDILTLTEAQLNQNVPEQEVSIPNYNLYTDCLYRQGRTARTVCYVNNKLPTKHCIDLDSPELSIVPLTVTKGNTKINIFFIL